jgi:hypothetical protein
MYPQSVNNKQIQNSLLHPNLQKTPNGGIMYEQTSEQILLHPPGPSSLDWAFAIVKETKKREYSPLIVRTCVRFRNLLRKQHPTRIKVKISYFRFHHMRIFYLMAGSNEGPWRHTDASKRFAADAASYCTKRQPTPRAFMVKGRWMNVVPQGQHTFCVSASSLSVPTSYKVAESKKATDLLECCRMTRQWSKHILSF